MKAVVQVRCPQCLNEIPIVAGVVETGAGEYKLDTPIPCPRCGYEISSVQNFPGLAGVVSGTIE